MEKRNQQLLRKLPSVDAVLNDPALRDRIQKVPRKLAVHAVRSAIAQARKALASGKVADMNPAGIKRKIISDARSLIEGSVQPHYRKVVNATGIILHTGLGRAVLAAHALKQIQEQLSGYSLLQLDVESGKRSKREQRIEWLLQQLTGAEAATVVNNNAAATAIVLNTIARGKEVIVSRGQLVEIGGSFRLPEVMAFSEARLVEVGTTNKTHQRDYENAITENTAAILRVHPSNYKIQGFTSEVALEELVKIAHSHGLIMIDDVGSGALIDFSRFGFEPEPYLPDSISKGADIVTSSADKLTGASQAGIILGKSDLIEAIRKNQFFRIVRVGKLTLAVLEGTLGLFLDEAAAFSEVPHARRMASRLSGSVTGAVVTTSPGFSQMGSGSLPAQNLATTLVAIKPNKTSAASLAVKLRRWTVPVFTRIHNDQVLIDPRTLRSGDDKIICEAMLSALGRKS
jgi:L-seryl-tRNA(Ser) seleniumtransferase